MKQWQKRLSGLMVPAVIAVSGTAFPVLAEETMPPAQTETQPGEVTPAVSEAEILPAENFGERLQALQLQEGITKIVLKEGTYTLTANELGRIAKAGLTIEGAGADKTVIDCAGKLTSGNAGILVEASNVTLKGFKIKTSVKFGTKKALVKAGKIAASAAVYPERISDFRLENVALEGDKESAAGLDINSVDGFTLSNVTISKSAKAGVGITSGTKGTLTGVTTSESVWGAVGIMAPAAVTNPEVPAQPDSAVKLGAGNKFGEKSLYIEQAGSGETKKDCGQITGEIPSGYAQTTAGGSKTVFAPLADMAGKEGFDQSFKLYGTAELTAPLAVSAALTVEGADGGAAVVNKSGSAFSVKAAGKLTLKNVDVTAKESCVVNEGETVISGSTLKADGVILKNAAVQDKMKATDVVLVPGTYEEGKVLAENVGELSGEIKDSGNQFWNIKVQNGNATMTKDTAVSFVSEASALLADANGNPAEVKAEIPNLSDAYEKADGEEGKNVTYSVVLKQADAAQNAPAGLPDGTLLQAFSVTIEKTVGKEKPVEVTPAKALDVKLTVSGNFVMDGIKLFHDSGAENTAPAEVAASADAAARTLSFQTKDFGKFWFAGQPAAEFAEELVMSGTYHGKAGGKEGDYAVIGKKLSVSLKEIEAAPAPEETGTEAEPVTPAADETPSEPVMAYQWYRSTDSGFELIDKAVSADYKPVAEDQGKQLKAAVTKDGAVKYTDAVTAVEALDSEYTSAPDAPKAYSTSTTSITLRTVKSEYDDATVEYGIEKSEDKITWQKSTRFTNLKANTRYYFYTRYAAEGVHAASKTSGASALWTDPVSSDPNNNNNNNHNRPGWGGIYIPGSSTSDGGPINFHDMNGYDWATAAVDALSSKGIIKGTSSYTFSPADSIKRADFVLMLDRMLGLNNVITSNFDDVPADAYYAEAVGRARSMGIIKGYDYSNFGPEDYISRQDIITMAYRAFLKKGIIHTSYNTIVLDKYEDRGEIADYAQEALVTMTDREIIIGNDENRVHPTDTATRAEIAVMCYRLYNLI